MSLATYRFLMRHHRVSCGPTDDDCFCACGCSGVEDRCEYWYRRYKAGKPVSRKHTCCK